MKSITVFTPTFNRAYLLPRLYKSLCEQSSKDFLWLIIDDGSTDNTKQLVDKWSKENKIEIQYQYKENGGMHTGHNLAYKLINTELNVCIDSDDYMPKEAVDKILNIWCKRINKFSIAGIIGLDARENLTILGTTMPINVAKGTLADLYYKYKAKGDKKLVLRTDAVNQFPRYPEYKNEKIVPLGSLYLMIDQEFEMLYSDEIFCIVEYQNEGSSKTILRQYKQSPQGFAYARKLKLEYSSSL
jgi:glycosyltransferase involved in cell wall biosynthesis